MNQGNTICSDERLRTLVESDEDSEETRSSTQHVEECPRCQARLEQLAAKPAEWRAVTDSLAMAERDDDLPEGRYASLAQRQRDPIAWTESMAQQLLSPPSHPELLGRIGRYDVERLIGAGGMGVVFKAFDTELNRPVAVKVLAPHLAGNGAARQRFAREARAAAAVMHEHVVPIHNVETDGAAPFLVMPFVAGESLQQRMDREGPLGLRELLRIALQTASGLAAAHAQGLVHRDVKPSNILLEQGVERALLTDFGLAQANDEASLTHTGYHPGTPQFMSPEQARGERVDARSDLFSLGSVIYTMCTGRAPFRAETSYGVLRRITDTDARPIREINPEIPEWLCDIVNKLLSKQADDRYESAEQLAGVLESCLAHVQHPTSSTAQEVTSGPSLPGRSAIRSRRSTGVLAAIAIAGISLLGVALWSLAQAPEPAGQAAAAAAAKDSLLNGDWSVEVISHNGVATKVNDNFEYYRFRFDAKKKKLTTEWKMKKGKPHVHTRGFTDNPSADPKQFTAYGDGLLFLAIYERKGDTLRIANFGRSEIARPPSFDAEKSQQAGSLIVFELKRIRQAQAKPSKSSDSGVENADKPKSADETEDAARQGPASDAPSA